MGERLFKKVDRLEQLKQLLLDRRLTKAEIARKLGVHRSTAAEYIADLEAQYIPVEEEDGYFFIDRDKYKFKVEFTQPAPCVSWARPLTDLPRSSANTCSVPPMC